MLRPASGDLSQDTVLDTAAAAVAVCDATRAGFPLVWANGAFELLTGWSVEQCRGRDAAWLLADPVGGAGVGSDEGGAGVGSDEGGAGVGSGGGGGGVAAATLHELLRDGAEDSVTVRARRHDGEVWWDECILAPVLDEAGGPARYAVVHSDVTERMQAEEAARRWLDGGAGDPAELWRRLQGSPAPLVLVHREGEVAAINGAASALLGREQHELVGADLIGAVVPAPDRRAAWRAFHRVAEGAPDARGSLETRVVSPTGAEGLVAWRTLRLGSPGGEGGGGALLCTVEDVTDRRAAEARIEQLRYQDEPTGLANGARLRQQTAAAVARAARQRTGVAVCAIGTGEVPRTGPAGTDKARAQLLRDVAGRLRGHIRTSDLVAHAGGGRFAVLLDGLGADAERVARRVVGDLRAALAMPLTVGGERLFVEMAVSAALYPRDAVEADALIARAHAGVETALRGRIARPAT